jgi:hypothetical protein
MSECKKSLTEHFAKNLKLYFEDCMEFTARLMRANMLQCLGTLFERKIPSASFRIPVRAL